MAHRPTSIPRGGPFRTRVALPRRSTQMIAASGNGPSASRRASTACADGPGYAAANSRGAALTIARVVSVELSRSKSRRAGTDGHPRPLLGGGQGIGLLRRPAELALSATKVAVRLTADELAGRRVHKEQIDDAA